MAEAHKAKPSHAAHTAKSSNASSKTSKASKTPKIVLSRHVVQGGQTLTSILSDHGLGQREINQWDDAMRTAAGNFQLSPGHVLNLRVDSAGRVLALNYDVDDLMRVLVEKRGTQLRGRTEPLQARVKMVGAEGTVQKTFSQAARQANIPDRIVSQMADILGWDYDFRRVRPGDRFKVLYERRVSADGRPLPPGKVLAVEIRGATRTAQAFYYDDAGEAVYVDETGRTVSRGFLRYPVEFSRISSHFAKHRFHPILQVGRPHNGVDFAAPQGTPVRAAAEGVVTMAGRNGDFGNHIEIKHEDSWVTTYSHLHDIVSTVQVGQRIRQGAVIGHVGQTGLATGAHLHFALFRGGVYLDPLTATVDIHRGVKDIKRFQLAKQALLRQIASLVRPPAPLTQAPVVVASLSAAQQPGPITFTE